MITDLALTIFEKKKLQLWVKDHPCDKSIELSFRLGEVVARCPCGSTVKLSSLSRGIHKDRRRFEK